MLARKGVISVIFFLMFVFSGISFAQAATCEGGAADGICNPDATETTWFPSEGTGCPDCTCNFNGGCGANENCVTCASDCRNCHTDGACLAVSGDDCRNEPAACGACAPVCGDGFCEGSEDPTNCPSDCRNCGNGVCAGSETCTNCFADCGACPTCELETVDEDCGGLRPAGPLTREQKPCVLYYCDPDQKVCVYDSEAFTGKPCSIEEEVFEPHYWDECHVDVCIGGVCVINATIDSSNSDSAGGMPPLANSGKPWMQGECVFDTVSGNIIYNETTVHPFCGHWGCELGETFNN